MTPPLAVSIYWDLPILLVVVSLVYAATRHDRWDRIFAEAFGWGARIAGFLFAIGAGLYALSTFGWDQRVGVAAIVLFALWYVVSFFRGRRSPAATEGKS